MHLNLVADNPYPQFDVYDGQTLLVRIKIDKEMQALRLTCNDSRRVFFIVEEKLRKENIFTLLNEYSQPLGSLTKDRTTGKSGEIEIEGMNLFYHLTSNPLTEIVLLENDRHHPVLNCRINDSVLSAYGDYINYFIFALSWFTFLAKEKNEVMHFAEA